MFQSFPSLRSHFSQISLSSISSILAQPSPSPTALYIDQLVLSAIQTQTNNQTLQDDLSRINIEKDEFCDLWKKALGKHLKKYLKKMQEIVLYHRGLTSNEEYKLSKTNLWALQTIKDIQRIGMLLNMTFEFIIMQKRWNCTCGHVVCQQRCSIIGVYEDIIKFSIINHNNLFRQIQRTLLQKENGELKRFQRMILAHSAQEQHQLFTLQIEQECNTVKVARQKKQKKKSKKNQQRAVFQDPCEQIINTLQKFQIEHQKRTSCNVSQEWLQRISHRTYFK